MGANESVENSKPRGGRRVREWGGYIWFMSFDTFLPVLLAWSVLLLPYPFPDLIGKLLADVPSVLTLGPPDVVV